MRVDGRPMRTLWPAAGRDALQVIDQRQLPHRPRRLRRYDKAQEHSRCRPQNPTMQLHAIPPNGNGANIA